MQRRRAYGWYIPFSGTFLFLAAALPLLRVHNRWIRMLDFPRMQLAAWSAFNLALSGMMRGRSRHGWGWTFLHTAVLFYQAKQLAPFTRFKTPESKSSREDADLSDTFSLVVANVLMTNRKALGLLAMIRRENPDIVLLNEPDDWWEKRFRELEDRYPWQVKVPQSDTYGMLLYSRLPLREIRVDRRVHADVPSIRSEVVLPSGKSFNIYCVHPKPPAEEHTEDRDAELYLVGMELRDSGLPGVVAGDLNDVAWSCTTRLFQKVSRTLDPRIGRGFYNTFHAQHSFLRYSLDHVFHTREFTLSDLRRLEKFGSDHFPIFIRLFLDPAASQVQAPPKLESEDRNQVAETMEKSGTRP
jgi:endonuclease/exonuclease/phosphatase (EEP) superfamily protein YafD